MTNNQYSSRPFRKIFLPIILGFVTVSFARAQAEGSILRFEISFPTTVLKSPNTGRLFVVLTQDPQSEPRRQVGSWRDSPPFFAVDVDHLKPEQPAVIDASTPGFPVRSLKQIPAGDYYVQSLL